ncbi:MAG: hypothetical protein OQL19_02060 [Gammaproteobacteria bacterium]|nr:hypothetical protein [Gammaproteobacteria bacterium]
MDNSLEDDEFAQFIINDYLAESDMIDEEKLASVCSSMEEFRAAMDCFKLKSGLIA